MIVFVDYQHLGKVLEPTHHQRAGSLATIKIGDVFATVSDNNAPLIYNLTGKLGKETKITKVIGKQLADFDKRMNICKNHIRSLKQRLRNN